MLFLRSWIYSTCNLSDNNKNWVIIICDKSPVTTGIHRCLVGYDKASKPANVIVIPVPGWMTFFFGFTSLLWINKKRHTSKLATISDECRFWTWWTGCVEHPAGIYNWLTPSPARLTPKITLEVMRKSILSLMDSGWDVNIQPVCNWRSNNWRSALTSCSADVQVNRETTFYYCMRKLVISNVSGTVIVLWPDICPGSPVLQPFHPFPHS